MKNPTLLITTTKIGLIRTLTPIEQASAKKFASICSLKWRLGKLLVSHKLHQDIQLAALENFQWSINCLDQSCAQIVCVDLELGVSAIQIWANVCHQSKKLIFIRIPSIHKLPQKLYPLQWTSKRLIDQLTAILIVVCLSPIILVLSLLVRLTSAGPIFSRKWSIGQRGKLFQEIKFRTTLKDKPGQYSQIIETQLDSQNTLDTSQMSQLGYWMRRYRLDLLPQFFNVLRGEMSIVGPRPLDLHEAIHVDLKYRSCLQFLPGMTDIIHSKKLLGPLDTKLNLQDEANYLSQWSLLKDTKILFKAIQKLLFFSKLQ
jgi:lipopolysaccharide/colanic/teichoic acid biosynthesis glycosyltransferase